MMGDFKLLEHFSMALKNRGELTLEQLKNKTDEYRKLHNEVVEAIWSLKIKKSRTTDNSECVVLLERINELQNILNKSQSEAQIAALLNEIKNKEITVTGFSKIGTGSPYTLSSL